MIREALARRDRTKARVEVADQTESDAGVSDSQPEAELTERRKAR